MRIDELELITFVRFSSDNLVRDSGLMVTIENGLQHSVEMESAFRGFTTPPTHSAPKAFSYPSGCNVHEEIVTE
jgi:hypothetical protein